MVAINEREWDRDRKIAKMDANGLSAYDLEIIGRSVRLDIPLQDPRALKQIADMLRGLANTIDFAVERDDLTLRQRLMTLKAEFTAASKRIRELHGATRKSL